jgi:hypothetical protein
VLVASNFGGPIAGLERKLAEDRSGGKPGEAEAPRVGGGGSWHTDIEYEPLPTHVSMFLVHKAPVARGAAGTWVEDPRKSGGYFNGSDAELTRRRNALPLNGGTSPGAVILLSLWQQVAATTARLACESLRNFGGQWQPTAVDGSGGCQRRLPSPPPPPGLGETAWFRADGALISLW